MPARTRIRVRSVALAFLAVVFGSTLAANSPVVAAPAIPGLRYVSPLPNAQMILPRSNVILALDQAPRQSVSELSAAISVFGSSSGAHAGRLALADDGRTLVFTPVEPFAWNERVTVRLASAFGTASAAAPGPTSFAFEIARGPAASLPLSLVDDWASGSDPTRLMHPTAPAAPSRAADSLPPDFPVISSTVYQTPAPGRLFVASFPFGGPQTPYLLILDDSGAPLFYRRMPSECTDFKMQPNGLLTYFDASTARYYAMDASYAVVDSFGCGNGYPTDLHDFHLLPNGHAVLMSYDAEPVDMSAVVPGGDPNATVVGLILQELDTEKNVVFQWRSWDHFQITDATYEDLTAPLIDYVHGNAIEVDTDGNWMISARHTDEITKINRQNGDVMWRWGGKHNEFTFIDDPLGFSHQHAIRRIDNGHVTLFDNGNFHDPAASRAVEYELDEVGKTARLVWSFANTPDQLGFVMGYVQRLPDGHTLIGWGGSKPDVTEVDADGNKVMELTLPAGVYSYRAYRWPWSTPLSVVPMPAATHLSLSITRGNPTRGRSEVSLSLGGPARVTLAVYDLAGREVMRPLDHADLSGGTHRVPLDLSAERPGLYFCSARAGADHATLRLIVAR
ncbi:MAG TPA: aryl-sulfate sulfotransferase [Candidatus Saccharimonadaceae bacterium]|jgi:hypothetical protein|nr:aryl-sulfate sulfotransferase [Candidatus Saccharimonadaceae bacterium]